MKRRSEKSPESHATTLATRLFLWLSLCFAQVPASASDSITRPLTGAETSSLEAFAETKAGLEVWYVDGSVAVSDDQLDALALVAFQPTPYSHYCIAPTISVFSESSVSPIEEWRIHENARPKYWFWYESCDNADSGNAITLSELVDLTILLRLRANQGDILAEGFNLLPDNHGFTKTHEPMSLTNVDLRFDSTHGVVYELRYSLTQCRGASLHVTLDSSQTAVIGAWEWLC